jgi:hypothetical protein
MPHLTLFTLLAQHLRTRWQQLREHPDAGYSTEAVLITALLVAVALAALAVIAGKVMERANSINLN